MPNEFKARRPANNRLTPEQREAWNIADRARKVGAKLLHRRNTGRTSGGRKSR